MAKRKKRGTGRKLETREGFFTFRAVEALPRIVDTDRCAAWLFEQLRPGRAGDICPCCGAEFGEKVKTTFRELKRVYCSSCGEWSKAAQGTPFHATKLSPVEILLAAVLVGLNADVPTFTRVLQRGDSAAREWRRRLHDYEGGADHE